ncbi:MAG: adenosine kinase [Chitinispirillaceae bacterium]|jgi:sugar/nucleoside kinase (ribokinase family)|nr:adenosine kinase [Chitinispirillaceae bacterium]
MNVNKSVVVGVGSALVDICLRESEEFLMSSGAHKGGMTLVDADKITQILKTSSVTPETVPGGSACNTILGIGKLGAPARFIGKRGEDELGTLFEKGLKNHSVEPKLFTSSTPTGRVLSIITPDAQRSMLTYLGASGETRPQEITPALFENAALVHLEGYLLFNRDLMLATLEAAKSSGAKISLDMASYTVVEAAKELIHTIIRDYIDIVIANEDESKAYTGIADEEKALEALSKEVEIAVVKLGKRGSLISHKGFVTQIKPIGDGAPVVDTTGAGDLWASGFLYGLLQGYSIERCGRLGSACGYEVCKVVGATIPEEGWQRIRAYK